MHKFRMNGTSLFESRINEQTNIFQPKSKLFIIFQNVIKNGEWPVKWTLKHGTFQSGLFVLCSCFTFLTNNDFMHYIILMAATNHTVFCIPLMIAMESNELNQIHGLQSKYSAGILPRSQFCELILVL